MNVLQRVLWVQPVSLEQDDSENWIEIQKVLRGYKARQNKLIMEMGKGNEKVREDGVPGITNYIFSETAARGMYRRWADLLIHENGKTWKKQLTNMRRSL